MCTSSSSPTYPTTHRAHSVHHAHLQDHLVDKQRQQESLWREDLQSGGNPRTTNPTGYEPKELATVSRLDAYSGDPYQLYDVHERFGEEDHQAPITEETEQFGKIGTADVPDSKLLQTSCIQSQMHFDDSVESIADSDLEDGELQKMLTSPLYAQKASVKPDAMVMQEREVSAQHTHADRKESLRSHSCSALLCHQLDAPLVFGVARMLALSERIQGCGLPGTARRERTPTRTVSTWTSKLCLAQSPLELTTSTLFAVPFVRRFACGVRPQVSTRTMILTVLISRNRGIGARDEAIGTRKHTWPRARRTMRKCTTSVIVPGSSSRQASSGCQESE